MLFVWALVSEAGKLKLFGKSNNSRESHGKDPLGSIPKFHFAFLIDIDLTSKFFESLLDRSSGLFDTRLFPTNEKDDFQDF